MNGYDCDTIRDMLAAHALGRLTLPEQEAVDTHVAACADCAAEQEVVRMLQTGLAELPAGLEARVLRAVRRATPSRRWNPARLAMAATLAAAVLGGTVIFERAGLPGVAPRPATTLSLETDGPGVSWQTEGDPLLHGGSALQELSEEELELILAELES